MRYHQDTGTVVSVNGQRATVRLDHRRTEACGSCCACSAFGAGLPTVQVERGELQEGDRVLVRIPQVSSALSILLIFVLPLALFMLGIWLGQRLEGGERVGNLSVLGGVAGLLAGERVGNLSVLGGVAGLLAALLTAWLVNRALARKAGPPRAERLSGPAHTAGEARDGAG